MRIWLFILGLATLACAMSYDSPDDYEQLQDLEQEQLRHFSSAAARCNDDTLSPGFLPPTWASRPESPDSPDQKPITTPEHEPYCPACDCKCDQAVCCTNYFMKSFIYSLPSRGWFWAAGVFVFVLYLPKLIADWFITMTTVIRLWRDGIVPRPTSGPAMRDDKQ
ncbi:hypothetical protein VTL71DRAFT_14131 [Oculimacula yallundae]|uniref:Uncharacterized protein n=1 Tax=Oculimacula yallundae TaxID=86028 RepID=A0ABR4CIY6_9HELO